MGDSARTIKIAGGGIAGMTAGIQLKKAGFNPIVYEKELEIGGNRHGDYEGLENWIFDESMTDFFVQSGFDYSQITSIPVNRFRVHTATVPSFLIHHHQPFFHMVKRGSGASNLDTELYRQCQSAGVQIQLGEKAPEDCDIRATGTANVAAYIRGINFSTSLQDQVHLLLGHEFAPKGYAYLIIINGEGTLATAYKKPKKSGIDPLKNSVDYFDNYGITIPEGKPFGSRGSFSLPFGGMTYPYKIGEAGGFQDYLFGFGIRMSMASGRGAALSILGKHKEAKQVFKGLNRKRRLSFVNRMLYERLNDHQMAEFAKKLSEVSNPLAILSGAYAWNFKNIRRWISMKNRYEVRPT